MHAHYCSINIGSIYSTKYGRGLAELQVVVVNSYPVEGMCNISPHISMHKPSYLTNWPCFTVFITKTIPFGELGEPIGFPVAQLKSVKVI